MFQTKPEALFVKNPTHVQDKYTQQTPIKKISFGLWDYRAHCCLCSQVTSVSEWQKAATQQKGEYQPELILHSGCHCLCSTLITNSTRSADTSHLLHQRLMWQSGQQTGRSPSKQGNILLNGFLAVVGGWLLCSYDKQNSSKKVYQEGRAGQYTEITNVNKIWDCIPS